MRRAESRVFFAQSLPPRAQALAARRDELGRKPVAGCVHLAASKPSELRPDDGIVRIKQRTPVTVADLRRPTRRVHNVGEQHRREHPIIGHVGLLAGEELGDLLKRLTPRFDEVENVAPRLVR